MPAVSTKPASGAAKRESFNPLLKSYPDSLKINSVSEGAEVLYVRLLAQCDDYGHYYADPRWILAKLFTTRMLLGEVAEEDISKRLEELWKVDLIQLYETDGERYLWVVNVCKRLRSDVKTDQRFPLPNAECVPYSARERIESGTLTQPNPTQPNPIESPNGDSCSEPPQAESAEPPVLVFPTKGKRRDWGLSQRKLDEYSEAFPGVDVLGELRAALQWCRDNPGRRKTPTGMAAFLTRWLTKANDRPRRHDGKSAADRNNTGSKPGDPGRGRL